MAFGPEWMAWETPGNNVGAHNWWIVSSRVKRKRILVPTGKKNKLRVYYLSWLRNRILHNDPEVEKKQGWITVGDLEGCIHYKVGKSRTRSTNSVSGHCSIKEPSCVLDVLINWMATPATQQPRRTTNTSVLILGSSNGRQRSNVVTKSQNRDSVNPILGFCPGLQNY